MIRKISAVILLNFCLIYAQPVENLNSSEIKLALEKLKVLGSILYIAAHPDDENTKALAYFSKGKLVRTGYLSLTRGDGGQNLIGDEQGDILGIIRTQELLQARKIDGAEQFFTRAIDFGYSKTPEETLSKWNKEKLLSDVVWVIRKFKPDIIITRFPVSGQGTHGHHTASAILALDAFRIAADPSVYPEQLQFVETWQPKRIYWNAWTPALNSMNIDPDTLLKINFGEYSPLLGKSYTEISAVARTMHKSQGFGDSGWRADFFNYFLLLDGSNSVNDIFDDVDLSWNKISSGDNVEKLINTAIDNYDFENPKNVIPVLLELYEEIQRVDNVHWKEIKSKEVLEIIRSCSGIWIEAIADDYLTTPGNKLNIAASIINRSDMTVDLKEINLTYQVKDSLINSTLSNGQLISVNRTVQIPTDINLSHPYWLENEHSENVYEISDQTLIGLPVKDFPLTGEFKISFEGKEIILTTPVFFRTTDPVEGEIYRQIEIAPPVTINIEKDLFLFSTNEPRSISISIKNNSDELNGTLLLNLEKDWKTVPEKYSINLKSKNEEQHYNFIIHPPDIPSESKLSVEVDINNKAYNRSTVSIDYPHFPIQTYYPEAKAKLVKLNIGQKVVDTIGYIAGSGDKVPDYLEELGFNVQILTDEILTNGSLKNYEVIVSGIRAYNTNDRAQVYSDKLMYYVKNGGTYIVQYNTAHNLQAQLGPYPLTISRDRVTEEDKQVKILQPDHKLFNYPNKITEDDFNGWVQERGLYFAGSWDEKYIPMLEMNDTGESPQKGSLLYAEYGSGKYFYTGLSFFRQLPAGNPGAYRLFINMISSGKNE